MVRKILAGIVLILTISVAVPAVAPASASANAGYMPCAHGPAGNYYRYPNNKNHLKLTFPPHWGATKYANAAVHGAVRLAVDSNWSTDIRSAIPVEQADVVVSAYYDPNDPAVARAGPSMVYSSDYCAIAKSILKFNTHYGLQPFYTEAVLGAVATHETGHTVGLTHQDDPTLWTLCDFQSIMQRSVGDFWNNSCKWNNFRVRDQYALNSVTPPVVASRTVDRGPTVPAPPHLIQAIYPEDLVD